MASRVKPWRAGRVDADDGIDAVEAIARRCRQRVKQRALLAAGVAVLDSPAAVAQASEILFINVSDEAALESVLFGQDASTVRTG